MNRMPDRLPIKLNNSELMPYLNKAYFTLGKFDTILSFLPNPKLLIAPLAAKEAVLSSKIEGTRSTIGDVYLYEAGGETKYEDVREVVNYCRALAYAERVLKSKPIHLNMIKEMHRILLSGVRGGYKAPGEFRRVQNWIGPPGATIENATYVPPSPEKVIEYMDNWEKYLHSKEYDVLVKTALMHIQFEAIHPFIDGNGRIGRILIPLFLYSKGLISHPAFYISEYFEHNRQEYYILLNQGHKDGVYEQWVIFFLEGVYWESEKIQQTVKQMLNLYNSIKEGLYGYKSVYSFKLLDTLFASPVITLSKAVKVLKLHKVTVNRLLKLFVELNILDETTKKRNNIYTFRRLLNIVQK